MILMAAGEIFKHGISGRAEQTAKPPVRRDPLLTRLRRRNTGSYEARCTVSYVDDELSSMIVDIDVVHGRCSQGETIQRLKQHTYYRPNPPRGFISGNKEQ